MANIIHGDCIEALAKMSDNSIDAVVTDPPYGLSFMGKKWDYDVPSVDVWRECLRVLKPGGHLLSFAGTRTQHRMAVNIEDAGFEIRDMLAWIYASGFPKSLNIGKKIPEFEGFGTSLKPALEPITLARKPIEKGLSIAENCLKWGTGGIDIDGCRIETEEDQRRPSRGGENGLTGTSTFKIRERKIEEQKIQGRFPANLIHDGSQEVLELFPNSKTARCEKPSDCKTDGETSFDCMRGNRPARGYDGEGSAARFFYCAKSSRSERNKGLDCYLTVKYNIPKTGGVLCKEVTVAVQLLQRVMSGQELVSFSIGESGASIMAQCHKDSLSTILTEINRIIELKTLNLLMHLLTRESTPVVNCETENGGNRVENAENLKKFLLTITKGNRELALGASHVVFQMLQLISAKENWKDATNFHSTVKPIALMEYLVKLVSREGQTVLDPFAGSGTTGIACKNLNRNAILIEREAEYVEIAKCRMGAT